jgi:DNA-binding NarL/FixJ family response regulator
VDAEQPVTAEDAAEIRRLIRIAGNVINRLQALTSGGVDVTKSMHRVGEWNPTQKAMTDRELQIWQLCADGLTKQQIATRLTITESTVNSHVVNVTQRLGMSPRQVIATGFRQGWFR